MEKHLIVLDLDGTLMTDLTSYDEETFAYLKELNEQGHIIMLATGRPKRSSYFVYEKLNLHTPLINYNGALVSNPVDNNFHVTDIRIKREDLLDIIEKIRPYLINVFLLYLLFHILYIHLNKQSLIYLLKLLEFVQYN